LSDKIKTGFEMEGKLLTLDSVVPVKQITRHMRTSAKYNTILASIKEIGIIEPPVVSPMKKESGVPQQYLLLDGHVRIDILKHLEVKEVFCIISTDDEGYTLNHKVNRLTAIQEHYMIMRIIEGGVDEDMIARTLNVNVGEIKQKRDILTGICPDAVELLKDKMIAQNTLRLFRKVKPMRQAEMAEMMNTVGNYSRPYALALLASTRKEMFNEEEYEKQTMTHSVKPEDIARMEREMESLERDVKLIEESYGRNVLNLVLARGYLAKLLDNAKVVRYLSNHNGDVLSEFQKIVEAASLET